MDFLIRGEGVFLQGVLQKSECRTWFFDGNCVVRCVVIVVFFTVTSMRRKFFIFLKFIFGVGSGPRPFGVLCS
jgi:hypothetical protein